MFTLYTRYPIVARACPSARASKGILHTNAYHAHRQFVYKIPYRREGGGGLKTDILVDVLWKRHQTTFGWPTILMQDTFARARTRPNFHNHPSPDVHALRVWIFQLLFLHIIFFNYYFSTFFSFTYLFVYMQDTLSSRARLAECAREQRYLAYNISIKTKFVAQFEIYSPFNHLILFE